MLEKFEKFEITNYEIIIGGQRRRIIEGYSAEEDNENSGS